IERVHKELAEQASDGIRRYIAPESCRGSRCRGTTVADEIGKKAVDDLEVVLVAPLIGKQAGSLNAAPGEREVPHLADNIDSRCHLVACGDEQGIRMGPDTQAELLWRRSLPSHAREIPLQLVGRCGDVA